MPEFLPPELSALEMALNCARSVQIYADAQDRDPVTSHISHLGERGHQAAQLAGNLALVSIAEDLHRLAEKLFADDTAEPENPPTL